jgi:uncharacterized protein YlxP (DUF503 family)
MPSPGFVAVLTIHLHFPEAGSLKAKRKELAPVKARLQGRHGATVAEIDHHGLWQRATLAAALVSGSASRLDDAVDGIERFLGERFPAGARVERRVASLEDLEG